jgi:hypothetical protein
VQAVKDKVWEHGLADLDLVVRDFNAGVLELSGGRFGIALGVAPGQEHPHIKQHKFYMLLVVREPERREQMALLDLWAAPESGFYPITVLDRGDPERWYPLGDRAALEQQCLSYVAHIGSPLVQLIAAPPEAQKGATK